MSETEKVFPYELVLKSPNGNFTITISAMNSGAGIWITRKDNHKPSVAIYNGFNEGAVVGVWAKHDKEHPQIGIDACLVADENDFGGSIQLTDKDDVVYSYDAKHVCTKITKPGLPE